MRWIPLCRKPCVRFRFSKMYGVSVWWENCNIKSTEGIYWEITDKCRKRITKNGIHLLGIREQSSSPKRERECVVVSLVQVCVSSSPKRGKDKTHDNMYATWCSPWQPRRMFNIRFFLSTATESSFASLPRLCLQSVHDERLVTSNLNIPGPKLLMSFYTAPASVAHIHTCICLGGTYPR